MHNIGQLTTDFDDGFFIETEASRELPYLNNFINAITYEVSLTRTTYRRRVDSFLDILGEIGGLFGALTPFFSALILVFHHRSEFMHIAVELFDEEE